MQRPPLHTDVFPLHIVPQAPQLLGSVSRLAQVPLQWVSPVAHAVTHWPETQVWLAPQAVPHAPQFEGSVATSAQAPEHSIWVPAHAAAQTPRLQTPLGAVQTVPQAPQSLGSL